MFVVGVAVKKGIAAGGLKFYLKLMLIEAVTPCFVSDC